MGSPKRLQKKDEYHYRKGSTNETQNCAWCKFYVDEVRMFKDAREPFAAGIDNREFTIEARCKLFGLDQSSRYRVRPDYTCDAQKSTYTAPAINWR